MTSQACGGCCAHNEDEQEKSEEYFVQEEVARAYDSYVVLNIPFYSSMVEYIAEVVRRTTEGKKDLRLVELGVGTGNISQGVLDKCSSSRFESLFLVDHSKFMLEIAREKLQKKLTVEEHHQHSKINTWCGSFEQDEWTRLANTNVNVLMAVLTLDHLQAESRVAKVFESIHKVLETGGTFILGEKCADKKEPKSWNSFKRMIEIRATHMSIHKIKTEAEIDRWKHHVLDEDHPKSVSLLCDIAEKVGFEVVEVYGAPLLEEELSFEEFYAMKKLQKIDDQHNEISKTCTFGVAVMVFRKR